MQNSEYVVEMRGIDKIYPNGIAANQGVDFLVKKGEIHALMGENGAGKSTLMKMLFGMEQPTNGEIYINGEKVALTSPTVAIAHGIGMVHQHFMLVPSLTVAENVVLGMEPRKGKLFVDFSKAIALTEEYSKKFNLEVDPNAKVMDIPVGMKQKVEILKALVRGAKILILDEPTAVLTTQETVELFRELVHLKEQGYTIIFISHKLKEIKEITDRMTILRGGRSMGVYNTADTSEQEISRLMVGRDVILTVQKDQAQPTAPVLQVRDLEYTNDWNRKMLNKVSFTVRKGEILGIAGVDGNGQSQLAQLVTGVIAPEGGTVDLKGSKVATFSPNGFISENVSHIPEDRNKMGLVGNMSVMENIVLKETDDPQFSDARGWHLKKRAIRTYAEKMQQKYDIRCQSVLQEARNLSGGNQQKVILARELENEPDLLVAVHPTRGLDIGATRFVHDTMIAARDKGCGVLLISADFDEILEMSDRIVVMFEGAVMGEYSGINPPIDQISLAMAGK